MLTAPRRKLFWHLPHTRHDEPSCLRQALHGAPLPACPSPARPYPCPARPPVEVQVLQPLYHITEVLNRCGLRDRDLQPKSSQEPAVKSPPPTRAVGPGLARDVSSPGIPVALVFPPWPPPLLLLGPFHLARPLPCAQPATALARSAHLQVTHGCWHAFWRVTCMPHSQPRPHTDVAHVAWAAACRPSPSAGLRCLP